MEILRKITIKNGDHISYRTYLSDGERSVTLDTPELLDDSVAIAKANAILELELELENEEEIV